MFLKGKKQGHRNAAAGGTTGTVAPASSASSPGQTRRQPSGVPSIVSADLRIEGDLHSIGDLQIDGVVNGDISSKTLTVGEGAEVHGAIEADSLRICGTVEGEVTAKVVVLTKTARVYGDVMHESLSVEAGALIHGFCKRLEDTVKRSSLPAPGTGQGMGEPAPKPAALTDAAATSPAAE